MLYTFNPTSTLMQACLAQLDVLAGMSLLEHHRALTMEIVEGYTTDAYCRKLFSLLGSMPNLEEQGGLLFLDQRLVIPNVPSLCTQLFHLAHDVGGHFGADKTYESLRGSFYWPNMWRNLVNSYIPSCSACMRNKSPTTVPAGPLHPLPVPDACGDSVVINFVSLLPEDLGFNMLLTMTDRLGTDIHLVPCHDNISACKLTQLFFAHWYCENRLPREIVSDRDKLFLSRFWKALHKLTNVSLKLSSSYHPQLDGVSEHTNKTMNQCIHFLVDQDQSGWISALPRVRFSIMNSVNASTGCSPFQLHLGRSPRLIPALFPRENRTDEDFDAHAC